VPASGQQGPHAAAPGSADARRAAAIRTLAVDDQTARVMTALAAAGIDALLLKGPAVARRLYGPGEARSYGDTDVLVAPQALAAARSTLRELGYEPIYAEPTADLIGHHGSHWRRPGSVLEVDLHHTLTGVRADPAELWRALREHATTLEIQGMDVRVPNAAALALHVALHAAQHGVARETPRRDLAHALRRLPRADWNEAAALAARLDAVDAFGVGLRLSPEGAALASELGLPRNRSRNAALRVMAAPSVTLGADRLAATPGLRHKGCLLLRWTFPPPDFMRSWSALARRRRGGLALAYAWRPLVLAAQVIPGALAWRRATRATRRGSAR
jgi:hypothetical protein